MFILCKFVKLQTQPHGIDVIDGKTGFELLVPVSHTRKVKTKKWNKQKAEWRFRKKKNIFFGRRRTKFYENKKNHFSCGAIITQNSNVRRYNSSDGPYLMKLLESYKPETLNDLWHTS